MSRLLGFLGILLLLQSSLAAAPSSEARKIKKLEAQVSLLQSEISELKLSVDSLNRLSDRLTQDLKQHEGNFKSRLSRVIIHLMQWPEKRWGGAASSWTELQRVNLVLEDVRKNLLRSPLKLMAERELRLDEVGRLTQELSTQMAELEAKQSLLDVQLEELRNLERRLKKKVPHATSKTKKFPKDPEPVE